MKKTYILRTCSLLICFFLTCLLLPAGTLYAYQHKSTVFESGADGYASYRIPAIVKLKNGHLIAFAEGRVDGAGDFGNVDIVYKTSRDSGKTWGALRVAVDNGEYQVGNAAPILDLLDPRYPHGVRRPVRR